MNIIRYCNPKTDKVVSIPEAESHPDVVPFQMAGTNELVYLVANELRIITGQHRAKTVKHPSFNEDLLADLREIRETFAGHVSQSLDEFEHDVRCDTNPLRWIPSRVGIHAAPLRCQMCDLCGRHTAR